MSVFTFVLDFFRAMLHLIWFSRRSFSNSLNIYVKSNTGSTLSVELDPKWDIKNVKEVIAPQLGMPPEEVKIILAGKELDDSLVIEVSFQTLKDTEFGTRRPIHAHVYN